jgi:hypothetical protein
MNEHSRLSDTEVTELLRRRSARSMPDTLAMTVLESLASEQALRPVRTARRSASGPMVLLAAAAVLLVAGGVVVVGSGIVRRASLVPPAPAPSFGPLGVASPAISPSPIESVPPTAALTPTSAPIRWTTSSLKEDWPASVRNEPIGQPTLVSIPSDGYVDPTGDNGSDAVPWEDITDVSLCGVCVNVGFLSGPPDGVDPSQQWFAYGLVVDTDGDGVPDFRYGIDNEPVGTPDADPGSPYRWWRTDLHTGRTEWTPREAQWEGTTGPFWGNHGSVSGRGSGLGFGGDVTGGGEIGALPKRFYAWASVIQDGRVVATDYAPDTGWLVPSPNGKP